LTLLSTALALRGAVVTPARTLAELALAASLTTFDAALLDLSPIAADVGAALRCVRVTSPAAKLVLISGSAGGLPDIAATLAAAWVRKPFEVSEVMGVLADLAPRR